jgi:hypothetical protein
MLRLIIIGTLSVLMTACVCPFWGPGGHGGPGPHFDGPGYHLPVGGHR